MNLFNGVLSVQARDPFPTSAEKQACHPGSFSPWDRKEINPVYLGKEDSREVITGSTPVQTPYFSTLFGFCFGRSQFSIARDGSDRNPHIVKNTYLSLVLRVSAFHF